MEVLVSFCNKNWKSKLYPETCLFRVDLKSKEVEPVRIGGMSGITGLAKYNDGFLVVTSDSRCLLLNKLFKIKKTLFFNALDAHSIIVLNNKFYVVSSGNDSIVEVESNKTFWKDNDKNLDIIHVNSLAFFENDLYVSAFGEKNKLWSSAKNGYIKNITKNLIIHKDLQQPHSIKFFNNKLYFCESATSCIKKLNESLFIGGGYLRGLDMNKNFLVVGLSEIRKQSKSTGILGPWGLTEGKVDIFGKCLVKVYKRKENLQKCSLIDQIDLSDYGSEIYDILLI